MSGHEHRRRPSPLVPAEYSDLPGASQSAIRPVTTSSTSDCDSTPRAPAKEQLGSQIHSSTPTHTEEQVPRRARLEPSTLELSSNGEETGATRESDESRSEGARTRVALSPACRASCTAPALDTCATSRPLMEPDNSLTKITRLTTPCVEH